jgi:hypothetical protein
MPYPIFTTSPTNVREFLRRGGSFGYSDRRVHVRVKSRRTQMRKIRAAMLALLSVAAANLMPHVAWAFSKPISSGLANRVSPSPSIKQIVSNCLVAPNSLVCKPLFVFTRGDFAVSVQRMFHLTKPSTEFSFGDVTSDSPIYSAVQAAAPFMNWRVLCPGCLFANNFLPNKPIAQAEVEVALVRIFVTAGKLQLLSPAAAESVLSRFPDATRLPSPARPYIATAISSRIIPPLTPNMLVPAATYYRLEGALVLEVAQAQYTQALVPLPTLPP